VEDTLTGLSMSDFEARVASIDATPGGGSVSALAGSLGSALGAMVWRLTQAKTSSDLSEERLDGLIAELDELGAALRAKVDEDAASYDGVITAIRLPKTTDAEKESRRAAIVAATRVATEVPLETARLCVEVMENCLVAARLGHAAAVTDAGVGLLAAFAGVKGALYNVRVNLAGASAEGRDDAMLDEVASLGVRAEAMLREGDALVGERLSCS